MIEAVQPGDAVVHGIEDRAAERGRALGQPRLPMDPALDMLHDVERRADDAGVLAQGVDARGRHPGAPQRRQHAVLALDGMRRGQQLSRRLAAYHVAAGGGADPVGGIALAAAELLDLDRAAKTLDVALEKGEKRVAVDFVRRTHRHRAGEARFAPASAQASRPSRASARQPMSPRQNPSGQSMRATAS